MLEIFPMRFWEKALPFGFMMELISYFVISFPQWLASRCVTFQLDDFWESWGAF